MADGTIALITDFGTRDYYVGAMKGVILSINPKAALIDVSHDVPPGDIRFGAYLLARVSGCFPPETVHLAVVDPGVGGDRRAIAVRSGSGTFVGPDNGLFTRILDGREAVSVIEITESRYFAGKISPTFHGRDLFAPVAAHLSLDTARFDGLGTVIDDPVMLDALEAKRVGETIVGTVIHVDRFGNIITNVPEGVLREFISGSDAIVKTGGKRIVGLVKTYCSVQEGHVLSLIGSSGYLEVSVNGGSASEALGVGAGDDITVHRCEKRSDRPADTESDGIPVADNSDQ